MIYFINFIVVLFLSTIYDFTKDKYIKKLLLMVLIFFISLLPGYRSITVGTDTRSYVSMFTSQNDFLGYYSLGIEPLFSLIISILNKIGFVDYSSYFLFFSLFISILVVKGIKNISEDNISLPLFSYLTISIMFFSQFNVLRQAIAVAIFLFSFKFLIERNNTKYVICILFACLFHYSAIFLLIMPFLFRIETRFYRILFSVLTVLFFVFLSTYLASLFSSLTGTERVLSNIDVKEASSGRSFLYFYTFILLCFYIVKFIRKKVDTVYDKLFEIVIILLIMFWFSVIFLGLNYRGPGRILMYFNTCFVLLPMTSVFDLKKYSRVMVCLLYVFFCFIYIYMLFQIGNIHEVNPYISNLNLNIF